MPLSLPEQIKTLVTDVEVVSLGGATEASIWSIYHPIEEVDPYGKPLRNQQFYILNDLMQPGPIWVPGQLYIGGIGLAQAYWKNKQKTQASFITHPVTQGRLYKTGDLGRYLPDGNIEFLNREDFQVKINGYSIELGEIEAVLRQHPTVKEAVVTALRESRDKKRLVGYVVSHKNATSNMQPGQSEAYDPHQLSGVIVSTLERIEFKLKQPGLPQLQGSQTTIELPKPEIDEALKQAYLARQIYRQFLAQSISLEEFSQFLSSLLPMQLENYPLPKYRYPSAGSLYPLQTYLLIKPNAVNGLEPGIYYYYAREHHLVLLSLVTEIDASAYGGNQPILEQSAFLIFLIGELNAISPMYGELAMNFSLLEASHMGELLMSNAPNYSIGLCPIGNLELGKLQGLFQLESSQILLYSFVGGKIDYKATTTWFSSNSNSGQKANFRSSELREHLRQYLPEYIVPKTLMQLEALPLTANGKVNYKGLPQPDLVELQEQAFTPPCISIEKQLAQMVDLICLDRVGIHDNFFEVGGDSLLATRPISIIRKMRAIEVRLRPQEWGLLVVMHHIICDYWFINIFIQELSTLYQSFSQGKPYKGLELVVQYADYAYWQSPRLNGESLSSQLSYGQEHLAGAPSMLQLPSDRPQSSVQSDGREAQTFVIDRSLAKQLPSLSQGFGATLFMTLLAAFYTLLYSYSAQEDIVIGSPYANRNRAEIEPLIGFIANVLVMRVPFEDNPSFVQLLEQVRFLTLGGYAHQDVPFEQIVEVLQPERSLSYSPLYQVMFVLQDVPKEPLVLPGVSFKRFTPETQTARLDLTLMMEESEQAHKESRYLVNLISSQQITTIHFVPSMLQVFLQELNLDNCSCLKRAFCSGEALSIVTKYTLKVTLDTWPIYPPIGKPIANTQIFILDQHWQPVPIDVPGFLFIGGANLARDYLNPQDLTAQKFVSNPFGKGLFYQTGDLVRYLPNGNITLIQITGELNLIAHEFALSEIIQRHEIRRTTFSTENRTPVQAIAQNQRVTIPVVDLRAATTIKEQNANVQSIANQKGMKPFDLGNGPPIRFKVLQLEDLTHVLLVIFHHIIFGAWSIGIFIKELISLYEAADSQKPCFLPSLPIQYADFARWQGQCLDGVLLEKQLSYSKQQKAGNLPVLQQLPIDYPPQETRNYQGGNITLHLSKELTTELKL